MAALTSLESTRKMKQLLSAVLVELPKRQAEKFHILPEVPDSSESLDDGE